jgi:hypothetical protein
MVQLQPARLRVRFEQDLLRRQLRGQHVRVLAGEPDLLNILRQRGLLLRELRERDVPLHQPKRKVHAELGLLQRPVRQQHLRRHAWRRMHCHRKLVLGQL